MKIFDASLCKWTAIFALICCFWRAGLEAYWPFGEAGAASAKSYGQRVAINPTANAATAVWSADMTGYNSVMAATMSAGVWSPAVTLSAVGENTSHPLVAVDASGNTVVVWTSFNASLGVGTMTATQLPAGGSWTTPIQISSSTESLPVPPPSLDVAPYQLVINSTGTAVAIWYSVIGNDMVIRSSTYSSGTWSAPVSLSP